jgi:hypothetical protein
MTAPVLRGGNLGRVARASSEYVNEIVSARKRIGNRSLTAKEKKQVLATVLSDKTSGIQRLGQSMIGPIQLKLRYQGLLRNVLLEDTLEPGVPIEYDVLDDLGQAYQLHSNEGEVKITPFEGKRVPVSLFRIASFPQIKKEDLYYLRANVVEYAQDETKQAIMKQEDAYLVNLIEAAVTDYSAKDPYGNSHVVSAPAGTLTPDVLYDAVSITDQLELESKRLLFNNVRYRDLYRWDINTTGWAFKDRVVAGEKIVQFGEFQIGKSIIIPQNTVYLTPEPEFLGVFPVMYSLDVEENNQVAQFHKGWVLDELVGMAILNPRGLVKISLS